MKKLLILAAFAALASCNPEQEVPQMETTVTKTPLQVEALGDQIDHGFSRITLDDTTHVLIYRGVESVTMIQLK